MFEPCSLMKTSVDISFIYALLDDHIINHNITPPLSSAFGFVIFLPCFFI